MSLDYADIKRIKQNILDDLYDELIDISTNCLKTDYLSLIMIFGEQKKPTQFDLEIKFHSPDDFDYFDIVNPITKNPIKRIDRESLSIAQEKSAEIEEKYRELIKKASNSQEKLSLESKKYNEKQQEIGQIKEIVCEKFSKEEVIEVCKKFASNFEKLIKLRSEE